MAQWEGELYAAMNSPERQNSLNGGNAHQMHIQKTCSGSEISPAAADSIGLLKATQPKAAVLRVCALGPHDLPPVAEDLDNGAVVD